MGPLAIQSCPEFYLRREAAAGLGTMALALISPCQVCQGNPCVVTLWSPGPGVHRPAQLCSLGEVPPLSGPHDYSYCSYLSNEGPFLLSDSQTL